MSEPYPPWAIFCPNCCWRALIVGGNRVKEVGESCSMCMDTLRGCCPIGELS
jgi:hypothetical protein